MTTARSIDTAVIHAGRHPDPATGAISAPIHLSTTFERDPDGGYPRGYVYARYGAPNRTALETCLAELDAGKGCAAFASGQAAAAAIFQSLSPGDHVIAPDDVYFGNARLLQDVFAPWGLGVSFVDMSRLDAVAAAFTPATRLVWIETPSNPLLKITDIAGVAELAHARGARVACDATWSSPILTQPIRHGADLVLHASTKYLGGHSDVLGGAVIWAAEDDMARRIRLMQTSVGGVPSSFDCWLVMRGLSTLAVRVRRQCETAAALARHFSASPAVEAVHYPGLPGHANHAVATRQMSMFGGMLSMQVRGDRARALRVVAGCRLFTRATSLGGVESLIEHRASNEPAGTATPDNLLRISIGLEDAHELIGDLQAALEGAG